MTSLTRSDTITGVKSVYSIYDAKAKLSEIIRQVKGRHSVVITERGRPVARVVPLEDTATLAGHIAELEAEGILSPPGEGTLADIKRAGRRPQALRRFLAERSRW